MSEEHPEWTTFAGRLEWVLRVLRIDQAEVDRRLGRDVTSRWLNGKATPRGKNMDALAETLGAQKTWLAHNEGDPFPGGTKPPPELVGPWPSKDDAIALVADVVQWLNGHRKPPASEVDRVRKLVADLAKGARNLPDGDDKT